MELRYNPKFFVIASNRYLELYTKVSHINEEIHDIASSMGEDSIAEHKRALLKSYEDLLTIADDLKKNSDVFLRIAEVYANAEAQIERNNNRLGKENIMDKHVSLNDDVLSDVKEKWILYLMKDNN